MSAVGLTATLAWRWSPADEPKAKDKETKHTNRLAKETSPYLLLHAHNPVDWYPWGPEAFEKAKKENKLIFLSIGYSSCHWCHVMERQSFNDPAIAKLMNDWFVCIKVDREERPDVDNIYMTALHVQGSHGGWPLSMFMLPDGKPLGGGTYWPPEDRVEDGETIAGFKTILTKVHEDWQKRPDKLKELGGALADGVQRALTTPGKQVVPVVLNNELIQGAVDAAKEEYDPLHGGFGSPQRGFRGPKFPQAPVLQFLLAEYERSKNADLLKMLTHTLDRMALGGLYDHLGGGFHRYTVEREWKIPHFEKMLYDNAQLISVYSAAYRLTKKPLYRRVVEETIAFLKRDMSSGAGFYSALDADSEDEEGKYYLWTAKQIDQALPRDEAELFKSVYGVDKGPNFEDKFNILFLPQTYADAAAARQWSEDQLLTRLQPARAKLLAIRSKRPRPLLDTKILTGWNGLMIVALCDAGMALDRKDYVENAARTAAYLFSNFRHNDGYLFRTRPIVNGSLGDPKLHGCLEDYAFLVHGLLELHNATTEKRWLDSAVAVTSTMIDRFADTTNGGFYFTAKDQEQLFVRTKDQYDGATPSGNSVAALNLVRLAKKTGDAKFAKQAEATFQAFGRQLQANPGSLNMLARALMLWLENRREVGK
jgi:uncharacterized protein YyaL (SSP411 family)